MIVIPGFPSKNPFIFGPSARSGIVVKNIDNMAAKNPAKQP